MSNKITYIIELVDQFSVKSAEIEAAMKAMSAQVNIVSKSFLKLETSIDKGLTSSLAKMSAYRRGVSQNITLPLNAAAMGAGKSASAISSALNKSKKPAVMGSLFSKKSLSNIALFGSSLRRNVTLPLGVSMFAMIKAHQTLETLAAGFGGALGSEKKGVDFVNQLQKFGQKTPFQLKDIMSAATQFVAVGEPVKKIIPDLKVMGDVAAMSGAHINDLAQELTKIKARGRMYQMDINILATHRVNMNKLIQDHIRLAGNAHRLSLLQVRQLIRSGAITYKTVMQLLSAMTSKGGLAYKQMIIHLDTTLGATRNLSDNIYQLSAALGSVIAKALNLTNNMLWLGAHIAYATNHMKGFIKTHRGLSTIIARFAALVVGLGVFIKIITVMGSIFGSVFKPMIMLSRSLIAALTGVDAAAVGLGTAFGWITVVVAAVMGIIYVCEHWRKILKDIKYVWSDIIKAAKHPLLTGQAIEHKIVHSLSSPIPADIAGSGFRLFGPNQEKTSSASSTITLNVNDRSNVIGDIHSKHSSGVNLRVGRNMSDTG